MLTGLSRDIAPLPDPRRVLRRRLHDGRGWRRSSTTRSRRKIVQMLLVAGAIGISGVVSSSILTLARKEDSILAPLLGLVVATLLLWAAMSFKPLDRLMTRIVAWALRRCHRHRHARLRRAPAHPTTSAPSPSSRSGPRACSRAVRSPRPPRDSPGIVLLGIQRAAGGEYVGAPPLDTRIEAGDVLTIYGRDRGRSPGSARRRPRPDANVRRLPRRPGATSRAQPPRLLQAPRDRRARARARDPVPAVADDPLPRLLQREDGREGARHRADRRHPARQPRGRGAGRPQGGRARRA